MSGSWKKFWRVRSYPEAVQRILRGMPRVYEAGFEAGIFGWMGHTFSHQRKDFKPKSPRLTGEREGRLVFQHDLVTPITYNIELEADGDGTIVKLEVRTSALLKDSAPADHVVSVCYTLTKALEPSE